MKKINVIGLILLAAHLLAAMPAFSQKSAPPDSISKRVDSLFVIASSGEVMYREMVQPATDSIVTMGAVAVPRLIEKYDTQDARDRTTINTILTRIGRPAVPFLVGALSLPNAEQVARICNTLGEIKDTVAVRGLLGLLKHRDWRVRSEVGGALGSINDPRGEKAVITLLSDSVEIVRKSAAVAAGKMIISRALPNLVHMLGDDFYGARMCASEALVRFGPAAIPAIADSLESAARLVGNLGCITLGMIGGDTVALPLAGQLKSSDPLRRTMAAEGVYLANSNLACSYVELMKPDETDSTVLYFINRVLKKYASR